VQQASEISCVAPDETLEAFGKALADIPEVLEAFLISGDYDYHIRIAVRDTRDYERLLRERLYRIPGIRHSRSCFVLRRLKENLAPPLDLQVPPAPQRKGETANGDQRQHKRSRRKA